MSALEQFLTAKQLGLTLEDSMSPELGKIQVVGELVRGPVDQLLTAIVQNPDQFRFILDDVDASGEKHGAKALTDHIQDAGWALTVEIQGESGDELTEGKQTYLQEKMQELDKYTQLLTQASSVPGLESFQSEDLTQQIEQTKASASAFLDGETHVLNQDAQPAGNVSDSDDGAIDEKMKVWEEGIKAQANHDRASGDWVALVDSAKRLSTLEDLSPEQKDVLNTLILSRDYGQFLQRLVTQIEDASHPNYHAVHELLRNDAALEQIQLTLLQKSQDLQQEGRSLIDEYASRHEKFGRPPTSLAWLSTVRNKLDLSVLREQTTKLSSLNLTGRLGFNEGMLTEIANNLNFVTYARQKAGADDRDLETYSTPPPQ